MIWRWLIRGILSIAAIVAFLVWIGAWGDVVSYVDAHNGFFSGVGALITAVATGVIAYYTKSTRDLFKLEETKVSSAEVRVTDKLKSIAATLRATALEVERVRERYGAVIEAAEEELEPDSEALEETRSHLRSLAVETAADIARRGVQRVTDEFAEAAEYAREVSPQLTKTVGILERECQPLEEAAEAIEPELGLWDWQRTCQNFFLKARNLHRELLFRTSINLTANERSKTPPEFFPGT